MNELIKEMMQSSLAVLMVEDVESDALLLVRLLKKAGYEVVYERVETAVQMHIALEKQTWDIIISDYSLPQFDGHAALTLLKETGLDIPFIIVSGTMGEEIAVSMMKAGAQDYLMKGDVVRLVPAVERELEQARLRRNHRQADEDLRESEERYRAVVQSAKDAIISSGSAGNIISWNRGAETIFGYAENEVIGLPVTTLIPSNYHKEHFAGMARVLDGGEKHMIGKTIEMEGLRKDGSKFPLEISLSEWQIAGEWYYTCAGYLVHPSDYLGFFAEISIRGSSFSSSWARFILSIRTGILWIIVFRKTLRSQATKYDTTSQLDDRLILFTLVRLILSLKMCASVQIHRA